MNKVTATIEQQKYRTRINTSAHEIFADEPLDLGGTDTSL
jgi:hypothetical protein